MPMIQLWQGSQLSHISFFATKIYSFQNFAVDIYSLQHFSFSNITLSKKPFSGFMFDVNFLAARQISPYTCDKLKVIIKRCGTKTQNSSNQSDIEMSPNTIQVSAQIIHLIQVCVQLLIKTSTTCISQWSKNGLIKKETINHVIVVCQNFNMSRFYLFPLDGIQ